VGEKQNTFNSEIKNSSRNIFCSNQSDQDDPKQSAEIHDGHRFKKKQVCERFYYRFKDQKRTDTVIWYDEEDIIVPKTWEMIGDTILKVQGLTMRILRFNSDSVKLRFAAENDTVFLIRNCKTVSKSKHF